jgi:ubiquinone/menaquinone biosynthesis C-methylase UbiE
MDEYTKKTKDWLEQRFRLCDEQGVYLAHQPIYGFNKGHCEKFEPILSRCVPTYQIMKALSHLKFNSLLDVGGAEGYKAALIRELFNVYVKSSDLSEEACKRAKEIYHLDSEQVDIHNLPFKENEFDVVVCSETLEHVSDHKKALDELLRVAKKAVVITVPHDPREFVDKNIKTQKIHGHIHVFNLDSLNFLKSRGYQVSRKKMLSSYTYVPILSRYTKRKIVVAMLVAIDGIASRLLPQYAGILIVALKKKKANRIVGKGNVSPYRILSFAVPKYHLACKLKNRT